MNTYNIIPRESLRSKRFFIYGNNEKTAYLPSGRGCTMGAAWVHLANQQPKRHNMQTQKRQEHRLEEVCTLLGPRPPVHFKHGCTRSARNCPCITVSQQPFVVSYCITSKCLWGARLLLSAISPQSNTTIATRQPPIQATPDASNEHTVVVPPHQSNQSPMRSMSTLWWYKPTVVAVSSDAVGELREGSGKRTAF